MKVVRLSNDAKANDEEYLELKSGEKIKVVHNGAYLSIENRNCIPVMTEKVGENVVEVLHDTGCNGVIIRRELVKEDDFLKQLIVLLDFLESTETLFVFYCLML